MSKKALYEGKSKEEIRKLEAYLDLMPAHIREMAYKDPASLKTALEVEETYLKTKECLKVGMQM